MSTFLRDLPGADAAPLPSTASRVPRLLALLAFAGWIAALLVGCGSSGDGTPAAPAAGAPTPSGTWPVAAKTATGTPVGTPASATIGAAGGTLASPDGRLVLTVPPGALASPAAVTIQPITGTAPGAIGTAWRLGPSGTTFAVPVQLRATFTEAELAGGAADLLGVAVQAPDGSWSRGTATVDAAARTVTVTTTGFSDWSLVQGLALRPGTASVRVGRSLPLQLAYCFAQPPGAAREQGFACDTEVLPLGLSVGNCAVNGVPGGNAAVGTVSYATGTATYTAPATRPSPAQVAVSCEATIAGRTGRTVLVSNVTVTDGLSYSGTIGGRLEMLGNVWSFSPTTLSGFTVDADSTIAGDVTKYVGGRGTASVTYTQAECDPVTVAVPVEASLLVWDPASPSANGAMARAYSIAIGGASSVVATANCGGARVPIAVTLMGFATDCPGVLANSQRYTDPASLAGAAEAVCTGPLPSTYRMQWSLQGR